jgi:acrylyl-CoA reductase (NADPH)
MERFQAFVAEQTDGEVKRAVRTLGAEDLPTGAVTVRVHFSSVNYKDALATIPKGRVARISPLVPGVDLAGEVTESSSPEIEVGQRVIVHGYDLGVAHHGGFAQYARVPAEWIVPLPDSLSTHQAMELGTAGFTAALSVQQLEQRGLKPGDGPVLVTGATGGVGSVAVGILARRGYEVAASTGKDATDFLKALGASEILSREETSAQSSRPLESERWAAAVDCVGGSTLPYILRTLRYGSAVAASGLTGGVELATTVMPFIIRSAALLGVDSVNTPLALRRELWNRLATDMRPSGLDEASPAQDVGIGELETTLDQILGGRIRGRVVVDLGAG